MSDKMKKPIRISNTKEIIYVENHTVKTKTLRLFLNFPCVVIVIIVVVIYYFAIISPTYKAKMYFMTFATRYH